MSRRIRVVLACVLQLLLVGAAVAPQLSARVTGEEYRLAVAPIDPIDPFRGAYVTLDYPGLPRGEDAADATELDGDVFVPLERDGELWKGARAVRQRPAEGPFLKCNGDGFRLRCGIESLFASQSEAKRLEQVLADGAVARIRVDGRGNATVLGLLPG